MAQPEPDIPPQRSAVVELALLIDGNQPWPDARVREFLGVVKAVLKEEPAIKLRGARLLAWARTRDVGVAGFPSWTAFVKEVSPWCGSRTREYIRLVESQLDVIKEAVSEGALDLTVATRAVKEIGREASRDAQLDWLTEVNLDPLPERHRGGMVVHSGDEMRRILEARDRASIFVGWDASVAAVDRYLVDCHEQKLTGEQITERARAVPPVPGRLGKVVPDWKDDPSVSLMGPWIEPTDIHDAVAKLRALEVILDKRRVLLAIAYSLIRFDYLWTSVPGCESLEQLCVEHLQVSQRTFQRYAHEGLKHRWYPEVRREIEAGRLTADRASFAFEHCGGGGLAKWLELVRRLGRAELERARERAKDGGDLPKDYAPALDLARTVESIRSAASGAAADEATSIGGVASGGASDGVADAPADGEATAFGGATEGEAGAGGEATAFGGTAERIARHLLAIGANGPIQVALREGARVGSAPRREPDSILAPPNLLAAADWFLAQVKLPREHGPRRMVAHDRYVCQNPRCRRRTVRVHLHHIVEKQHGGSDEPENVLTGCPACHLRGIHSGQMSVVRIGDWLVWAWLGGEVVLMHSPVSDLAEVRTVPLEAAQAAPLKPAPAAHRPVDSANNPDREVAMV